MSYSSIDRSITLFLGRKSRDESTSYIPEDEPEEASIIRHVTVERCNVLQRITFGELQETILFHISRIFEFCSERKHCISESTSHIFTTTEDDLNTDVFEIGRLSSLRLLKPDIIGSLVDFSPAAFLGSMGAIKALLEILNLYSNPTMMRQTALYFFLQYTLDSLWNISAFSENKEIIVRNDAISILFAFSSGCGLTTYSSESHIDPFIIKKRRAIATIVHNVSETRFRNGEKNQVQRRILEEGGVDLALSLLKVSLLDKNEIETSIISSLTLCHLSTYPNALIEFPILKEGLELVIEKVIKPGIYLKKQGNTGTGNVFQGWLSFMPFVALLEETDQLYIHLFSLQAIYILLTNDNENDRNIERNVRKFIRDLAMMNGIKKLRQFAEFIPLDSYHHHQQETSLDMIQVNNDENTTSQLTVETEFEARLECSRCARVIIKQLKAIHTRPDYANIEQDTLGFDLSQLFISDIVEEEEKEEEEEGKKLKAQPLHSDATLHCINESGKVVGIFFIHRAIISARVPSLAPLLSPVSVWSNISSSSSNHIVKLHNSSNKGIEALLNWCYSSQPKLTSENALEALEVADCYCCSGLKKLCELFLCQSVNQSTAQTMYDIAMRFNANQLAAFSKLHIQQEKKKEEERN